MKLADIWGVKQIAEATGLGRRTIHTLKTYGRLPPPDLLRAGRPLWKRSTIRAWCAGSRRDANGNPGKVRPFDEAYEPGPYDDAE